MRRHALFIGLLVLIAAARFAILLTSQTHVHSDEAIIGLMGKHILEGRYFPFYMYGQPYNAGAAWEAYFAAIAFALFGVSAIDLIGFVVVLSLVGLFLFYRMCLALYDQRAAVLATIVFAIIPSLLKWHFQVRGYSWYFLSIPVLTLLFLSIESTPNRRWPLFLLFGIVSAFSVWSLELGITFNIALWILLLLRRNLSLKNALVAVGGLLLGYTPAIAFNLTHHFANWNVVREKTGGGLALFFRLEALSQIFLIEMPKFFGPDTVLWYYPQKPASGFVFYAVAVLVVLVAVWPFIKAPSKILQAVGGNLADYRQNADFAMLVLTAACFVPYLTVSPGVPSYFFGGCFFLSALTGRMLERSFSSSNALARLGGAAVLGAILLTGIFVTVEAGWENQIETLSSCDNGTHYCMTRISAADTEGVEHYLRQHNVRSVWTTISFVYPLLFETSETLAVSNAIFESPYRVYPKQIRWREPDLRNGLRS